MIGELVDRLVSVVSPASAARRTQARRAYRGAAQRAYDGARSDRLNSGWLAQNRSADMELAESADTIRARARSLVQNNAYARGIIRADVRNVVGVGIRPQARVPDQEAFNSAAESRFSRWQRRADVGGRLSFYEMQAVARSEIKEAGECLIRFVASADRRRPVPLALELIDVDQLATDAHPRGLNPETGNEVRRGIELDDNGQPVRYWLYSSHPHGTSPGRQRAVAYDAAEFVHLFESQRAGQTRGVSSFAPVVSMMKNLGYYIDNELQSSAIASCFSVLITSAAGGADGGLGDGVSSDSDVDGNTFETIQPGAIMRGIARQGESAEVIDPGRSHSDSRVWIELMIRSLAVGTGLSYERLSRDYSQTNYSSNRASDLEDRREFRPAQQYLIEHLCQPVWERFLAAAVQGGAAEFPDATGFLANYDQGIGDGGWTACTWQAPGWEWVDPLKEQRASHEAISHGLSTLEHEAGKRGADWKDVLAQRAREQAMIASLGLNGQEE